MNKLMNTEKNDFNNNKDNFRCFLVITSFDLSAEFVDF